MSTVERRKAAEMLIQWTRLGECTVGDFYEREVEGATCAVNGDSRDVVAAALPVLTNRTLDIELRIMAAGLIADFCEDGVDVAEFSALLEFVKTEIEDPAFFGTEEEAEIGGTFSGTILGAVQTILWALPWFNDLFYDDLHAADNTRPLTSQAISLLMQIIKLCRTARTCDVRREAIGSLGDVLARMANTRPTIRVPDLAVRFLIDLAQVRLTEDIGAGPELLRFERDLLEGLHFLYEHISPTVSIKPAGDAASALAMLSSAGCPAAWQYFCDLLTDPHDQDAFSAIAPSSGCWRKGDAVYPSTRRLALEKLPLALPKDLVDLYEINDRRVVGAAGADRVGVKQEASNSKEEKAGGDLVQEEDTRRDRGLQVGDKLAKALSLTEGALDIDRVLTTLEGIVAGSRHRAPLKRFALVAFAKILLHPLFDGDASGYDQRCGGGEWRAGFRERRAARLVAAVFNILRASEATPVAAVLGLSDDPAPANPSAAYDERWVAPNVAYTKTLRLASLQVLAEQTPQSPAVFRAWRGLVLGATSTADLSRHEAENVDATNKPKENVDVDLPSLTKRERCLLAKLGAKALRGQSNAGTRMEHDIIGFLRSIMDRALFGGDGGIMADIASANGASANGASASGATANTNAGGGRPSAMMLGESNPRARGIALGKLGEAVAAIIAEMVD